MSPLRDREQKRHQRQQEREEREAAARRENDNDPTGDVDAEDDEQPGGPLEPLKRAVLARYRREQPTTADLQRCQKEKGSDNVECRGGKRSDRPQCLKFAGSLNIDMIARGGLGDWDWVARTCRLEGLDGDMVIERGGGDSHTYFKNTLDVKLLAQRELREQGLAFASENCRLAYRSNLTWAAMGATAMPRLRDRLIEASVERVLIGKQTDARISVAVAGPRFSSVERKRPSGLSTDNSNAIVLAAELASVDDLGLTARETDVLKRVIAGDVEAAREAVRWMYGTVQTPDKVWRQQIRRVRTKDGMATQIVDLSEWPNPAKPTRAACQMLADGTLVAMMPAPRGVKNDKWGAGKYRTEVVDGVIHSVCGSGESELRELEGEDVYRIDVEGASVKFDG